MSSNSFLDVYKNYPEFQLSKDLKSLTAWGQKFSILSPFQIYSKLYREETNPQLKFIFMKKLHDMMWPHLVDTWHTWTEERFVAYCQGYSCISLAAGGSAGKSADCARIGLIEYFCSPKDTAVIVASTTLKSLQARVFGYFCNYLMECALPLTYNIRQGNSPQIFYNRKDAIHCIDAMAAPRGTPKDAIRNYIGRHPKRKLLLILDEATDLEPSVLDARANLEMGDVSLQIIVVGNSTDHSDLHGLLSTPKNGWSSVNMNMNRWETTQKNGICLYFDPFKSPAILEQDPVKKKKLSFLINQQAIDEGIEKYGKDSPLFYRFILGFWPPLGSTSTAISKKLIEASHCHLPGHFAGLKNLQVVAGLDPAFSGIGDHCILRMALLGQEISGKMILDFKQDKLLFKIPINALDQRSAEIQIADSVISIMNAHGVSFQNLAIDASAQGRSLSEVIKLRAQLSYDIIRLFSHGGAAKNQSLPDKDGILQISSQQLWFTMRTFIHHDQIRGIDSVAYAQFHTRMTHVDEKNGRETLESKREYKTRMGALSGYLNRSPDEADAATIALQAAIIRFGFSPGQAFNIPAYKTFEDKKLAQFLSDRRLVEQKLMTSVGAVKRVEHPSANFTTGPESLPKFGFH